MNSDAASQPEPAHSQQHDPGCYEIRFAGQLDRRWSAWFDGMVVTAGADGTTALRGQVVDQAALHGLLARLRDTGLPLVSVTRIDAQTAVDCRAADDQS